jgi:hypothetical protein
MSVRAFIQHNFWLKLFSLLLGTLIWFAIHFGIRNDFSLPENPITNPMTRQFVRLPVRVLDRPGDPRMFRIEPDQVVVSVAGEAAILRDLSPENISAFVDLANVHSPRQTNQQVRLDVPDGVTVIKITPLAVNVEQITALEPASEPAPKSTNSAP